MSAKDFNFIKLSLNQNTPKIESEFVKRIVTVPDVDVIGRNQKLEKENECLVYGWKQLPQYKAQLKESKSKPNKIQQNKGKKSRTYISKQILDLIQDNMSAELINSPELKNSKTYNAFFEDDEYNEVYSQSNTKVTQLIVLTLMVILIQFAIIYGIIFAKKIIGKQNQNILLNQTFKGAQIKFLIQPHYIFQFFCQKIELSSFHHQMLLLEVEEYKYFYNF